jgi:DNA polymerase-4
MAVRLARKVCPDLILLPPNPRLYSRASRALHEVLQRYAPIIEPRWYGHAFLDVSGTERLFGTPTDLARRIHREALESIRLPLTVGVATNKLVSEAATRVGRSTGVPSTEVWPLAVPAGDEAPFLAPRPILVLPEVPDPIRRRLDDYQIDLIGEVAGISEPDLCAVFGSAGRTLRARARGIDPRPVLPPEIRSEYEMAHTLATDTNDLEILHTLLRRFAERLGRRLRQRGLAAQRIVVSVDYVDFTTASRGIATEATLDTELWHAATRALRLAMSKRLAVRRIAMTAHRLIEANPQLSFWDPPDLPLPALIQQAIDQVSGGGGAVGSNRRLRCGSG